MSSHYRPQYHQPVEKAKWDGSSAAVQEDAQGPEADQEQRRRATRWWIQKRTLILFICCFLAISGAVGHHHYYSYLHGKRAENQAWVVRSGTAISFTVKLLFSASIGVGFVQTVWRSLRSNTYSLSAVDSLFTLRDNPLAFFNGEVLSRAKLSSLIAALSWALALVPILVPASISVRPAAHIQRVDSLPIYTLNFTKDVIESRYYNNTQIFPVQLARHQGSGALWNAYSESTAAATGFIYNTLYGKRIVEAPSPCGANCSFEQTFQGPAYKCDDIDFATAADGNNPFCAFTGTTEFGACGAIFGDSRNGNSLDGITWYRAQNSSRGQPECDDDSCPAARLAWQDGKLWVAYQYMLPEYRGLVDDAGQLRDTATKVPTAAFDRRMFMCQSYNATYKIRRWYQDFQQTITGGITYLNPTNFTALQANTPTPEAYGAYAIHEILYSLLSGYMDPGGRTGPVDTTHLATSALVEEMPFPPRTQSAFLTPSAQKPVQNLRQAFEQLHFNITVGLLSLAPALLYADNGTATGVETSTVENVWQYDPLILLVVYAAAAVVDIIVIAVGVWAMARNGGAAGLEFARVVAATRASKALNTAVGAWEDVVDPVPAAMEKTKVRYGHVDDGSGPRRRVGFGLEGEVTPLT